MSKTIEQYRQIVKVLKLQLLKVRQENTTLSKTLGISIESETSSFTPRLEKLKGSGKQFAKHLSLFNLFAHRCELIGVTPEMVFRIADKKRDKKVSTASFGQIMKRLKLKFDDVEISNFVRLITKSGSMLYEEYLQFLNAFQINSQKYPSNGQRTYSQICLLRFGQESKSLFKQKKLSGDSLFKQINSREGSPYLSFESFSSFCKEKIALKDVETIGAFVCLDTQTECQIDKEVFVREMTKVLDLLERGVNIEEQHRDNNSRGKGDIEREYEGKTQGRPNRQISHEDKDDFSVGEETGVENTAKSKKPAKKDKKADSRLTQQLKKQGISANKLITKLLDDEQKRKLVKPYSLLDFYKSIQQIKKSISKKKILEFFKLLDYSNNGSVSTDELVRLWLDGREAVDSSEILFKLLARHMKQQQCEQYLTKFNTSGYEAKDVVTAKVLKDVMAGLELSDNYIAQIVSLLPDKCTVEMMVNLMEAKSQAQKKEFRPLAKKQYEKMNEIIKSIVPKQPKNFPFKARLEDDRDKGSEKKFWDTIFTDEWACWDYCLQTAAKLNSPWRDHEFGPSAGDPSGFRSIVGNESQIPPGLPCEDEIGWMTFEELLQKQGRKDEVKLFSENLDANEIVQGKLGDCWFVSALSIITGNDEFVKGKSAKQCTANPSLGLTYGIHPIIFQIFRQHGIYVFKFFKGYVPVYVLVDDLFPIQKSTNELIFAKSPDPGLQWVAFLEKAYSKLHHCYCNMISGDISQGLADLTNALPVKEDITNVNPEELLNKVIKLNSQSQLMGCSINAPKGGAVESPVTLDDEKTGLFYGHAYSIADLIQLKTKEEEFKLMRVRNPWGHGEWGLDWSDNPKDPDYKKLVQYQKNIDQYYQEKKELAKKNRQNPDEIKVYKPAEDGQFLMNFSDFSKIFNNLFTGYNIGSKNYQIYSMKGSWDKSTPSGICKAKGATEAERTKMVTDNYQFILQVKEETQIVMFLVQEDGRLYRGEKYPYKQICNGIIILVFNLSDNQKRLKMFDTAKMTLPTLKFQLKRQTNFWHKFKPGKYAVIPCKMQNKIPETQFQFRVYADKQISMSNPDKPEKFEVVGRNEKPVNPKAKELFDIINPEKNKK